MCIDEYIAISINPNASEYVNQRGLPTRLMAILAKYQWDVFYILCILWEHRKILKNIQLYVTIY